jgi:hypothetical protein
MSYSEYHVHLIKMLTSLPSCNGESPANTSLAHQLLRLYEYNELQGQKQEWSLDDIKGAAGAVFIAGADTVSLLHHNS